MKRCFKSKRWIAFFLAVLLIVTTCINSSDVFLLAAEDNRITEPELPVSSPAEEKAVMEVKEETEPVEVTDEADTEESENEETDSGLQQSPVEETEQETDQGEVQEPVKEEVPKEEAAEEISETVEGAVTYNYAVYYYYDGTEDEDARVEGTGAFGDPIFTSAANETVHNGKSYVLDHVENEDGKIGEDAGGNVVKVYYVLTEEVGLERPEQTLTVTADDGARVTVKAPEGALPKGAKVTAKVVTVTSEMQKAVEDAAGEKAVKILKAYDVTITDAEGNEIQPDESVKVTIQNANVEGENLSVYHMSEEGTEKVADNADGEKTSFEVEHFSILMFTETLAYEESLKQQWVYVYIQLNEESMSNAEALRSLGLDVNEHGWITLGKVQVSIPQIQIGDELTNTEYFKTTVNALERIERYMSEPYQFDFDQIEWKTLRAEYGANGYTGSDKPSWHLDGYLDLSKLSYEIEYVDADTKDGIAESVQRTGFFGEQIQVDNHKREIDNYTYERVELIAYEKEE